LLRNTFFLWIKDVTMTGRLLPTWNMVQK
jgi:hypothetical protein